MKSITLWPLTRPSMRCWTSLMAAPLGQTRSAEDTANCIDGCGVGTPRTAPQDSERVAHADLKHGREAHLAQRVVPALVAEDRAPHAAGAGGVLGHQPEVGGDAPAALDRQPR